MLFYARDILNLRPIGPMEPDCDAASWGLAIHEILADFMSAAPDFRDREGALDLFARDGKESLCARGAADQGAKRYQWRRFSRIADWFVRYEAERQDRRAETRVEQGGELKLELGEKEKPFILTARADRIDISRDGRVEILDYKTGRVSASGRGRFRFVSSIALGGGAPSRRRVRGDSARLRIPRFQLQ